MGSGKRSGSARGGGARSGQRDVGALLDELYATPPPDFVARRGELAAEAKADGRAEDARRLRAARRPTLAAWAANLLVQAEPSDCERFLALGRALREAYGSLDADEIKQLSAQRGEVVAALSRQAVALARDAGHRLSDAAQQDVVSTLRAVLADQESAELWATGRLESALTPPSEFPASAPPEAPRRERKPRKTAPVRDELAERRERREKERLATARKAAAEAARRADKALERQRTEEDKAESALRRARDRHARARDQVAEAERQLQTAREALHQAEQGRRDAERRAEQSAEATARAEREAREAAEEVERLGE
ncbi:hypothetical protein [Streptomyces sp. Da 82-17]|uniref:hypothetical protein n=1 Tax=Streptomyces sp. Da 82-17 TaxID=3377116 RepID=UPI0038D4033B